ncbi:hypothetical protein [Dactylosporangium sp. NPDC051541]|uniref:hypothetical protein n=1 Tax=Dactylosporangium sp. NPDC051541 TaxID=3363977 RepID=UPI003790C3AE
MRLTWRDGAATLLVATVLALYTAHAEGVDALMLSSTRFAGTTALVLGLAACVLGGNTIASKVDVTIGATLGVTALIAAAVTIAGGTDAALAVLVGGTAALWAFTTARRLWRPHVEPPPAESLLDQHKDELPPRLNVG